MTLQDILRHEPPQRKARIPKGSPRQSSEYSAMFSFVRKERDIKGV